ncbi:MAG: hypothetical protein MJD61_09810 [Proteobacteria bacterium]|nr:hypothetical protein [Pseudomonadota bacterium]
MSALSSLLVRDQVVSVAQIEEALQRQVLSGCEIDQALLELGAVPENVLNAYRAAAFALVPASREQLMSSPPEVVRLIPAQEAARYRLVPVAREGRRLVVAAADPVAPGIRRELGSLSGCEIETRIAVDARICAALAKHYGITVPESMQGLIARLEHTDAGPLRIKGRSETPGIARPPDRGSTPVGASPAQGDPRTAAVAASTAVDAPPQASGPAWSLGPLTPGIVQELLRSAPNRDTIVELCFAYARQFFDCAVAFAVRGDTVHSVGIEGLPAELAGERLTFALREPGLLHDAFHGRVAVQSNTGHASDPALARMHRTAARPVVVLPVVLRKRTVLLLYGDRAGQPFELADLAHLTDVLPSVGQAFERVLKARKAQRTAGSSRNRLAPPSAPDAAETQQPAGGAAPMAPPASMPAASPAHTDARAGKQEPGTGRPPETAAPLAAVGTATRAPAVRSPGTGRRRRGRPVTLRSLGRGVGASDRSPPQRPHARPDSTPLEPPPSDAAPSDAAPPNQSATSRNALSVLGIPRSAPPPPEVPPRPRSSAPRPAAPNPETPPEAGGNWERGRVPPVAIPNGEGQTTGRQARDTRPDSQARVRRVREARDAHDAHEARHAPSPTPEEPSVPPVPGPHEPTIIVDMGEQLSALVGRLRTCRAGYETPVISSLLRMGDAALPLLVQSFPGTLWLQRDGARQRVPAAREISGIARALLAFGKRAGPYLAPLLRAPQEETRWCATVVASEIAHPSLVEPLLERLFDRRAKARLPALKGLRALRQSAEYAAALDQLRAVAAEQGREPAERITVIAALADLRDEGAVDVLIVGLEAREQAVVEAAARALSLVTAQDFGRVSRRWRQWAQRNQRRDRVEWLIDSLMHAEEAMRAQAGAELQQVTRQYYGYHPSASKRTRERVQRKYVQWLERERRRAVSIR